MIEILIPDPPTKFAEFVTSWGTMIDQTRAFAASKQWNGNQKKMIPSKSYDLGAYPPNIIGDKHYE